MTPLRLLVVTDQFWPVVSAGAMALEQLCLAVVRRGHSVRVLTRRNQKYWSASLRIGDIEVERLAYCPRTRFGNLRLTRHVGQWLGLGLERDTFDLLLVDPFDPLAPSVISFAARHKSPLCIWQASDEAGGWDSVWPKIRRSLTALKERSLWVISEPACADAIRAAEIGARRVLVGGPYVDCAPVPELTKAAARAALAENQRVLNVAPGEPILVMRGDGKPSPGAIEAIEAWRWVQQAYPHARFWITGDDEFARQASELIRSRDLTNEVLLVGRFDDWSELLRAADLMIQPDNPIRPPFAALMAMRFGLPVVVIADDASPRTWFQPDSTGFGHVSGHPRRLAQRLIELLEQPSNREQVADRARKIVLRQHDLELAVARLEQFGREVCAERESVRS